MKNKKLLAFIIPFGFCIAVLAYAYSGYSAEQLAGGGSTADIKRIELADYQARTGLIRPARIAAAPMVRTEYAGSALFFENPMASSGTDPIYAEWVYEGSAQLRYETFVASGATSPVIGNEGSAQLEVDNLMASTKYNK